jgi:hypothetical protein
MLLKNLLLIDDQDLDYAIHYKSKIAVWQNCVIVETGMIESYSPCVSMVVIGFSNKYS